MIGRVALLVTFKKAKPKSQSLSRSHIRDLANIMRKIQILILSLFLSLNSFASQSEADTFLFSVIQNLDVLNKALIEYESELDQSSNLDANTRSSMKFVENLVKVYNSFNTTEKQLKNKELNEVISDYKSITEDLMGEVYSFIAKGKSEGKFNSNEALNKIRFVAQFYGNITQGACMTLVEEKPRKYRKQDVQFIALTEKSHLEAKQQLVSLFGDQIKQNSSTAKGFESSAIILYSFLDLDWNYLH